MPGGHLADDVFVCIYFNENVWILLKYRCSLFHGIYFPTFTDSDNGLAHRPGASMSMWKVPFIVCQRGARCLSLFEPNWYFGVPNNDKQCFYLYSRDPCLRLSTIDELINPCASKNDICLIFYKGFNLINDSSCPSSTFWYTWMWRNYPTKFLCYHLCWKCNFLAFPDWLAASLTANQNRY